MDKRKSLIQIVNMFNERFGTDYSLFRGTLLIGDTCVWLGAPKWVSLIQELDERLMKIYEGSFKDFLKIEDEFERLVSYHIVFPRTIRMLAEKEII